MSYFGQFAFPLPVTNSLNLVSITASTALTTSSYGKTLLIVSPANFTLVLPPVLAANKLESITFINDSSTGTTTINASGVDRIRLQGVSVASFSLAPGDVAVLDNNGSGWSFADNSSWKANLNSPAFVNVPTAPTAAFGTSTGQLASTGFVMQELGNLRGVASITANTTLTAASAGVLLAVQATAQITLTLPFLAGLPAGSNFIVSNGGFNTVLSTSGTDKISAFGSPVSNITLVPNERIVVTAGPALSSWIISNFDQLGTPAFLNPTTLTPAAGDSSFSIPTTEWVAQRGITGSGQTNVSTSGIVPAKAAGGSFFINSTTSTTQTLPAANSVPVGTRILFFNGNSGSATVTRAGTDFIAANGANTTSIILGNGDTLDLESNGANLWYAVDGSAALFFRPGFLSLVSAAAGFQKLPSGLIIQWGSVSIPGSSTGNFNLAIPFPSQTFIGLACVGIPGGGAFNTGFPSLTQISVQNTGTSTQLGSYLALGK